MNILLLGSGGREDALAWRLRQSPSCDKLIAAPGNPGIARWAECVAIDPCAGADVVKLAQREAIDLVVVGPEAPLVAGVADALRAAGIATFGPSAAAAQLEGSKGFTKDLCRANAIPTADYVRVETMREASPRSTISASRRHQGRRPRRRQRRDRRDDSRRGRGGDRCGG